MDSGVRTSKILAQRIRDRLEGMRTRKQVREFDSLKAAIETRIDDGSAHSKTP